MAIDPAILVFLTSGLFLGWALGANDAANVFGTAVGTRMVSFATAAVICCVFVTLGAVVSGGGAAHTLGKLGAINTLPGSFMAAFSAATAVYLMTKAGLPVSTTQAIVGGIIGWNLFSETLTDSASLAKILTTWAVCPLLAAAVAIALYTFIKWLLGKIDLHLLRTDAYTRIGLILAGAFGSYSLGANNIGNVMGVFVPSSPFTAFDVGGLFTVSSVQQLFLIGALAIGVGVITYSKRVMITVGSGLVPLTPIAAWVVVVSHSIVLFIFASRGLEHFLASQGLPTIPLVPVSSSQAVVGAVIGIAIVKGGRGIRWRVLGGIGAGWLATPVVACLICFVGLFFLQNVFNQKAFEPVAYTVSPAVADRLASQALPARDLEPVIGKTFETAVDFSDALDEIGDLSPVDKRNAFAAAEIHHMVIGDQRIDRIEKGPLSPPQIEALRDLGGRGYTHKWQLADALAEETPDWRILPENKLHRTWNRKVRSDLDFVYRLFHIAP